MITIDIRKSQRFQTECSAFVSFEYDAKVVNTLRSLPFKNYNPENKTWEVPTDKVKFLIESFEGMAITLTGQLSQLEDRPVSLELPEGFEFKTQPYKHQIEGIKYGLDYDRWFLGDEQGLGKTKQAIDIAVARKLKYGYKHCLIVCGVNTLKWNWRNEIITHSNEAPWILGQKKRRDGVMYIGSMKDKINDLKWLLTNETSTYFLITNVESFRDETFAKTVKELCDKKIINMCVADEMHKMKNPTAQQTKGFLKCLPECRIGMTGTPLMNSPLDLYVILKWLGYESHAFYSFKNHYCIMGGYGGYEVIGYKNMDQLTEQVREIMLRRLKDDVLDLPEKVYVDEYVEMGKQQAEIYKEVEMDIKMNIDQVEFQNNPLATLIRLRQATGYTGILSSTVKESAKLDRLEDIVEEALSNNEKVIIFSNWTQVTDAVFERLYDKYSVAQITGETPDNMRQQTVKSFQETPDTKVLIGTIGAMGTGLTLTAGKTVIFMDEPWNKALYDQAVDRAHRIGQKNNITIYNLLTKDTIDERIHNIIYKKGAMSDAIIDGKIMGNKTEVFNYLLG